LRNAKRRAHLRNEDIDEFRLSGESIPADDERAKKPRESPILFVYMMIVYDAKSNGKREVNTSGRGM